VTEEAFNPYTVLGIPPSASDEEIKDAWREAAQKAHPDRPGGSADRMIQVNEAYQILRDPARRAQFDAGQGTTQTVSLERKAKDFLIPMVGLIIRSAPASANVIALLANGIQNQQRSLRESRTKALAEIEGLRLRLRRLKGPPENFIEDVIREEIGKGERLLLTFDLDELVMVKALEVLKDFSYEEEPALPRIILSAYGQSLLPGYGQ
jgi:curved DNA-binding protein CbpA